MSFHKLIHTFKKVNAKSILLLCHQNADPDALCSAYALSCLLTNYDSSYRIAITAYQGLNKPSKQILNYLPIPVEDSLDLTETEAMVLLDTNTLEQLGPWKNLIETSKKPLVVIDHHSLHPHTELISILSIIDEHASATCEILYELYHQALLKPNEKEALALLLGIAYDTKHFKIATLRTFQIIVELIQIGVNVEKALNILSIDMDQSERIARLKAANRLRIITLNEWLLGLSHVNSYHASAARALLGLGAHLVIVGGKRKQSLIISMRALQFFFEKTHIHLGRDIAQPLGKYLNGMGGGHTTSAGVNGEGNLEDAFEECIRLIKKKLEISHF
jgi:nanoRNase/pAp phosphatase (c-di-AMP/oligoRNAs hydrolase)